MVVPTAIILGLTGPAASAFPRIRWFGGPPADASPVDVIRLISTKVSSGIWNHSECIL